MAGLLDTAQQRLMGLLNIPTEAQRFATNPQAFLSLLGINKLPQATGFAAGATGLPAKDILPGGVLNPPNLAYQQGYEQGEPFSYAAMASPLAKPAAKALAPKAYDMLENYMVQTGGLLPLTAYHGTPHTIQGKFDINKVGTGEGAQAYGHGMYFAENPSVAKGYADKLGYDYQYMGKTPKENSPTDLALRWLKNLDWDKEAAKAQWKNEGLGAKVIQAIDKVDLKKVKTPGNLYKVDIPDEYIPNMLDWDKPLSQQNAGVLTSIKIPQKAADRYNEISNKLEELQWTKGGLDSPEWNKLFEEAKDIKAKYGLHRSGEELYREAYKIAEKAGAANPSQAAAESLKAQGIPGIRYLDEGSRNKGKGTSNFVVFDPSTVNILEKNSKKVEGLLD